MTEYSKEALLQKNKAELLELAASLNVVGRSKMNKGDLAEAIINKKDQKVSKIVRKDDVVQDVRDSSSHSNVILRWIGGYLLGSWTFLQFLDWILIRNEISPYWTDMCLWLLLGILPSFLIYVFNMERINHFVFRRWEKIAIPMNFIVLIGAVFLMFRGSDLGATTTEISYINEDGVEETKKVIKEEFKTSIPIFPYEYISDDSTWYDHCLSLNAFLAYDLDFYPHIAASDISLPRNRIGIEPYSTSEKIARSKLFNSDIYIDGSIDYRSNGNLIEVTTNVRNKNNGKLISKITSTGKDPLAVADSLAFHLPDLLKISATDREQKVNMSVGEIATKNLDALRYFSIAQTVGPLVINMEKAIAHDSTFAIAHFWKAEHNRTSSRGKLETKASIDQAMKYRKRLPLQDQIAIMYSRYAIYEEWDKAEELIKMQLKQDANNDDYQWSLRELYLETDQYEKLYEYSRSVFNKNPSSSSASIAFARACLLTGRPDKLIQLIKPLLVIDPQNIDMLGLKAVSHIHLKEYDDAREAINKVILIDPEHEIIIAPLLTAIDYMENHPDYPKLFNRYLGPKKASSGGQIFDFRVRDNQLLAKVPNQTSVFFYPDSDSSFVYSGSNCLRFIGLNDERGLLREIKFTSEVKGRPPFVGFRWVYDEVIKDAERLIVEKDYDTAELAYNKAIEKHPEHFYLRQMQEHLDYRKSRSELELQNELQKLTGTYEGSGRIAKLWLENGLLYYKSDGASRRVLRPIGNNKFINLLYKQFIYEFDFNNGEPIGMFYHQYDRDLKEYVKDEEYYLEKKRLKG